MHVSMCLNEGGGNKAAPFYRHIRLNISQTALLLTRVSICCSQPFPLECQLHSSRCQGHTSYSLPNPLVSDVGSAFKMYPESDHLGPLCCYYFSPSHHHLSPGLSLLVPNWSPSFCPLYPYNLFSTCRPEGSI